jgi:low affinity Fe/Cu permease
MGKVLTRNEIDQILRSTQRKKEPSITLNDVLTSDELNQYRDSIHQYAKEKGIKLDEVSSKDIYNIAKQLNFDKFIYHDENGIEEK